MKIFVARWVTLVGLLYYWYGWDPGDAAEVRASRSVMDALVK
jgi:hypothetical protein